ncbi:MAG: FAD-binding oxidoreductase [Candidatus Dormibacter sp.]
MTAAHLGVPVWGIPAPLAPPACLPTRAEVVIVGGGITGVALLHVLRGRDVDAILLERDHVAAGASGRNAGFLLAGVAENYARAVARHGRDIAAAVWAFTIENHALTAAAAAGLDTGYRRRGSMTVALDDEEAASLEEAATLLAEDGFGADLLRPSDAPGGVCALFNPADGEVDPVRLVHNLAAMHTGRVFEHHRALAVEDGQNTSAVRLTDGSIEAGAVVLATNAWTSQLLPNLPIRPVRAQMLATAAGDRRLGVPVYADWGHRYWRQRDDGSVLVGGFRHHAIAEEVGLDATPTERVQCLLDGQLRDLDVEAAVTHRWAGIMGFSDDGLPLVGPAPGCRRIHVCGGYTGHGLGFAINAAKALSGQLLDSTPLPAWIDVARTGALRPPASRR